MEQCAIKKEEQITKLQTFDLCYFVGKNLFGNGGFQNHSYYIVFKRRQRYWESYFLEIKRVI